MAYGEEVRTAKMGRETQQRTNSQLCVPSLPGYRDRLVASLVYMELGPKDKRWHEDRVYATDTLVWPLLRLVNFLCAERFLFKFYSFADMIDRMSHTLNMTLPLKQDAQSLAALQNLKTNFATVAQGAIDAAVAKSRLVHFARVVVIDDKYIQVLTEYDGEVEIYTEFFRKELPGVFELIFSLADGVPAWADMNNPDAFFKVSAGFNVRSLGTSTENIDQEGYLFSAYPGKMVTEIQTALAGGSALSAGV